jgi:hypothetical protein
MRKVLAAVAFAVLATSSLPAAAGPTQGGVTSDNVEYIGHVSFEVGTATGMQVIGKYLYITSWKSFSIYDVSDPLNPERVSTVPFGFKFENEEVATNGKIMIFSEQLPQNILHIWDVEDKENPQQIAQLPGGGGHTAECILNCKYVYSSTGVISDLRDPTKPKLAGNWGKGMPATSAHHMREVAPGMVLTASQPFIYLDARKNPLKPKLVAVGDDKRITGGMHSNQWPNNAKDDIVMFSSESNATGRCRGVNGAFMTWDASDYKRTHQFKLLDIYQLSNGTGADGSPPVNGLGCSAHWFQEHATFKNGGLVAMGSYEHGTRFIDVASNGKIKEVGYFMPWAGSTSAAYWLNKKIVYAVDYSRGIDILKYNGKT